MVRQLGLVAVLAAAMALVSVDSANNLSKSQSGLAELVYGYLRV